MQHSPGNRALALVVGLLFAASGSAFAQDTTETGRAAIDTTAPEAGAIDTAGVDTAAVDTTRDTTDTSGVQNPPGYRGMERDTTIFPDEGGAPATPGQVEDAATGTYEDSAWNDTTGTEQNPAGYRGYGRVTGDTAGTTDTTDTTGTADTTGTTDTTTVGDTEPNVEETPTPRIDPSESAGGDTAGQSPDSTQ